jgi:hypothetical protein
MKPDATWLALETLWCKALLPEGVDVVQRVTTRVLALRGAAKCDRIGGCLLEVGCDYCKCRPKIGIGTE